MRAILETAASSPVDGSQVSAQRNILVQLTFVCLRELLADLLATRMMGFGFFVAQAEFLKTLLRWPGRLVEVSGYPGIRFRLSVMLNQLLEEDYPGNVRSFLLANRNVSPAAVDALLRFIEGWKNRLTPSAGYSPATLIDQRLWALVERAVTQSLESLAQVARSAIPDNRCARLSPRFFERIKRLELKLPPSLLGEDQASFSEIMAASWSYQMLLGEEIESRKGDLPARMKEYDETCRLVLKAIELVPSGPPAAPPLAGGRPVTRSAESGVLSATSIYERLCLPPEDEQHLAIVPTDFAAVQGASLNVHLGNWFAAPRRTRLQSVQLGVETQELLLATLSREESFIPHSKTFLIHPGDLILGVTLEFLGLPRDLMAFVEGRSRLGRSGLIVATATQVAPGFHGVIVLELANAGTVPLELKPGMPIAQLVFQRLTSQVPADKLYRGRFYCQIKP